MEHEPFQRVLGTLRAIEDLDQLHASLSNPESDLLAPRLRDWMLEVVRVERERRENGTEPNYPYVEARDDWTSDEVAMAVCFAAKLCEAATISGVPQLIDFAFRLLGMLVLQLGAMAISYEYTLLSQPRGQ